MLLLSYIREGIDKKRGIRIACSVHVFFLLFFRGAFVALINGMNGTQSKTNPNKIIPRCALQGWKKKECCRNSIITWERMSPIEHEANDFAKGRIYFIYFGCFGPSGQWWQWCWSRDPDPQFRQNTFLK